MQRIADHVHEVDLLNVNRTIEVLVVNQLVHPNAVLVILEVDDREGIKMVMQIEVVEVLNIFLEVLITMVAVI